MRKYIVLLGMTFILTGCAAKYGESSFLSGGHSTHQISDHEFLVEYHPGIFNSSDDPGLRDKFIMIRAAEVTLKNGYTHYTFSPFGSGVKVYCYNQDNAPIEAREAKKTLAYLAK